MKLLWENEIKNKSDIHYIIRRQTPTLRPFLSIHTHDYPEIILLKKGSCIHTVNTFKQKIYPGDILFVPPNIVRHQITNVNDDVLFLQILFDPKLISIISEHYQIQEWETLWNSKNPKSFSLNPLEQKWFENNLNILEVTENRSFEIKRFLINLLSMIKDKTSIKNKTEKKPDWIERAITQIQEPEHFKQGVQGFINLCGRSQEHVERVVKKQTDKTITEIINEARMTWASYMLQYTDMEITEICCGCGFKSLSHFFKIFKVFFNTTPYKYKKQFKDVSILPSKLINTNFIE